MVFALLVTGCSTSDDVTPIIPINVVCETPTNLSASEITEVSVVLHWDNLSNDPAVNIEYGLSGFSLGNGTTRSTSQNSISIGGLASDTSYDFYVQALCSVNNTQSNVGSFTTNECNTPLNLSVSEITADSAIVHWENPNVNQDVTVEYGITGFSPGNGTVITASQNSISIGGLIPDTTYDFYVQAICSDNNTQSEVGTFTTNTASPFAGTWSGTYDGDDTGTWTSIIDANGEFVSGSAFSNNLQSTETMASFTITTNGEVTTTYANGNETIGVGQITGENIVGTWINPADGASGNWEGNRE